MFDFISKAISAKNALENAPMEMPGIGGALKAKDQYQQQKQGFLNNIMPQAINNISDMKYKMRAGLASNLGMPMDTFIDDEDFYRAGIERPKPYDASENMMFNKLYELYRRQ